MWQRFKIKTYKRIPIPAAIYQLMQVYLKKHHIAADSYIFQNIKGGAYQSSTFRSQMIRCCRELGIQNGEYMFRSHDYRHGVATYFYDSRVSIQGVRDYLVMQRTGLSRGFFYKNLAVRKEIDRALEQQAGMVDPRREVMDMAMNNELAMLHKQVEELKAENERLRQELAATTKSLVKKNIGVLKKMV